VSFIVARAVLTFNQHDLKRALRAAGAVGKVVERVEIEHGKIALIFADTNAREISQPAALDAWRASRGAR
jgi:hypothetical protein